MELENCPAHSALLNPCIWRVNIIIGISTEIRSAKMNSKTEAEKRSIMKLYINFNVSFNWIQ